MTGHTPWGIRNEDGEMCVEQNRIFPSSTEEERGVAHRNYDENTESVMQTHQQRTTTAFPLLPPCLDCGVALVWFWYGV